MVPQVPGLGQELQGVGKGGVGDDLALGPDLASPRVGMLCIFVSATLHIFFSQSTILHIYQNKISSFLQIY